MDEAKDIKNERNLPGMAGGPKRKPVPEKKAKQTRSAKWDTAPHVFFAVTLMACVAYRWPLRWTISGAPTLFYSLLLGESHGYRILPFIPLWTVFSTLNLAYAVCSTSWLLYWVFAAACYPTIILACLFQFDYAAHIGRRSSRKFLKGLHFINDKVALFNLPALEIDTDVNGLFVIRGATLSLSTLTVVAHGIEVGVKLSEDMELAIQVESVKVKLFRKIEVEDVYANIKGGDWEMTFGSLGPIEHDDDDDDFIAKDTQILRAATGALDGSSKSLPTARSELTGGGGTPKDLSDTEEVLKSVTAISPDEEKASKTYAEIIDHIKETNTVNIARAELEESATQDEINLDFDNLNHVRAAICTHIHEQPSIPHPPSQSVRLSTLKKTNYPNFKIFLHRLPLLLRLLLNPLAYFHPISIKSVTAAGSGKWFKYLMKEYFFRHYTTQDQEIRRLERRISAWLADANFAVEMVDLTATAQVPVNTSFDIECNFKMKDVMAYRTLPGAEDLTQVVRIGGADATISIPSYMLPHHEHLLPPVPTEFDEMKLEQEVTELEDTPQGVQAQTALEQLRKDEANMNISAHAHLPLRVHQDLLNFTAALVKATKVIESDKDFEQIKAARELNRASMSSPVPSEAASVASETSSVLSDNSTITNSTVSDPANNQKSFKAFLRKVDTGFKEAGVTMKDGMRKAGLNTASAMANDRWIAKLVGKVVQKLERAQGDVGYSGNIPVSLEDWRARAEPHTKLLP